MLLPNVISVNRFLYVLLYANSPPSRKVSCDIVHNDPARTNAGTVYVNRCDYLDPELAWVGIKDSGHGCTLSPPGLPVPDAAQELPPEAADELVECGANSDQEAGGRQNGYRHEVSQRQRNSSQSPFCALRQCRTMSQPHGTSDYRTFSRRQTSLSMLLPATIQRWPACTNTLAAWRGFQGVLRTSSQCTPSAECHTSFRLPPGAW